MCNFQWNRGDGVETGFFLLFYCKFSFRIMIWEYGRHFRLKFLALEISISNKFPWNSQNLGLLFAKLCMMSKALQSLCFKHYSLKATLPTSKNEEFHSKTGKLYFSHYIATLWCLSQNADENRNENLIIFKLWRYEHNNVHFVQFFAVNRSGNCLLENNLKHVRTDNALLNMT